MAKSVIIYSGKGGVGKTTTTANLARLIAKTNTVAVIDGDIATPSMQVEFPSKNSGNIRVYSLGYTYKSKILIDSRMGKRFFNECKRDLESNPVDYILIDTPPSIGDAHIAICESFNVGGIILISQALALSREDVLRTRDFFFGKFKVPLVIVENMCTGNDVFDYGVKTIARIRFADKFDTSNLLEDNIEEYKKIVEFINATGNIVQRAYQPNKLTDETFTLEEEYKTFNRGENYKFTAVNDDGTKSDFVTPLEFINIRTWDFIKSIINRPDELLPEMKNDRRLSLATAEKLERIIKHFENSDGNALVMVTNPPPTEIPLIIGEISSAEIFFYKKYYNLPCVRYNTGKGSVILFPNEYMPVTDKELMQRVEEGYIKLSDGRFYPSEEILDELMGCFEGFIGQTYENAMEIYNRNVK